MGTVSTPGEPNQKPNPINDMFKTILMYLQLGLDLLKAEPHDVERIQALQTQVTTLNAELAAARASLPTEEDKTAIDDVLAQFAALETHTPKPPVTLEGVVPVAVSEEEQIPSNFTPGTDPAYSTAPVPNPEDTPPAEWYPTPEAVAPEVEAAPVAETPAEEATEGSDGQ